LVRNPGWQGCHPRCAKRGQHPAVTKNGCYVAYDPGFALLEAWEMAGSGSGHTWARGNPWAEL